MKKHIVNTIAASFCFLLSFVVFSQTGPAGVGNSTSNILWLKSDSILGLSNGDQIVTWEDASGNGNDLTQVDLNLRPEYVANNVNGFPVASFNTANDRIVRNPLPGWPISNITAIYVNRNNAQSSDGILSFAYSGPNNKFLSYGSQKNGIYRFSGATALANNLRFTLATINTSVTPLPTSLTNFQGENISANKNALFCSTASESNNDYFTIEKSLDAQNWQYLNEVKGAGNSTSDINYQIIDNRVNARVTYYRLSQTDFDGTSVINKIIAVKRNDANQGVEIKVFPNPTSGLVKVVGASETKDISLFNSYGQLIATELKSTNVNNEFIIDLTKHSNRLYLLKVGEETIKIIVIK